MDRKMLILMIILLFSTIAATAAVTVTPQRSGLPTILNGDHDAGSADVIDGAIRTGDGKGGAWT